MQVFLKKGEKDIAGKKLIFRMANIGMVRQYFGLIKGRFI